MRTLSLSVAAGVLGVVVIIWQIPFIGSGPASLWMPLGALGIAIILLAIAQLRHHGG